MAISRKAGVALVHKNMASYEKLWADALTRRKLPAKKLTVSKEGGVYRLKVRLVPPEVFALVIDNGE
jgi:hypothetical protein